MGQMSDDSTWVLYGLYVVLLVALVGHFISLSLKRQQHSFEGLQKIYTLFTFSLVVFRIVYMSMQAAEFDWKHYWVKVSLVWFPIALQYSSFTCILLIYVRHAFEESNTPYFEEKWSKLGQLSNVVFYGLGLFCIGYGELSDDIEFSEDFTIISSCLIYLVLAFCFIILAVVIYRKPKSYPITMLYQSTERSWIILSVVLLVTFGHRSIYNCYYIFVSEENTSPFQRTMDNKLNTEFTIWVIFWEIVPSFSTLAFLKIPQGRDARKSYSSQYVIPDAVSQTIVWSPYQRHTDHTASVDSIADLKDNGFGQVNSKVKISPYQNSSYRAQTSYRSIPLPPESNTESEEFLSRS